MKPAVPVWRSLLYVPVNVEKYVDKAHVPTLRVIARDPASSVSARDHDPIEAARALGAAIAVTGSVMSVGKGLHVTAQLVDTVTSCYRWSDSIEVAKSDVPSAHVIVAGRRAAELGTPVVVAEARAEEAGRGVAVVVRRVELTGVARAATRTGHAVIDATVVAVAAVRELHCG